MLKYYKNRMNTRIAFFSSFLCAVALASCDPTPVDSPSTKPVPDTTVVPDTRPVSATTRPEQYRPQVHYTPHHAWSNDPNGLVFDGSTWHLYYQCTPSHNGAGGVHFAEMSWGHATSTDLMHWTERPVVLTPDNMGAIFSGCSVLDTANRAGFGPDAILAYYTAAGESQQICLAVSTDHGMTFTKYAGNPVVASSLPEFRDPKVVFDDQSGRYVMGIARGYQHGIEIWTSENLLQWAFQGIFTTDYAACNQGQWECCDFVPFDVDGERKWVLLLSTNPGGQYNYSGMMYFVGSFDANGMYVPDSRDYPLWFDGGMDCYAGVTFDHAPNGRHVLMAWMNNWDYATTVPPTVWRSAYTLPRDVSLTARNGLYYLAQTLSPELDLLASPWQQIITQAQPLISQNQSPISNAQPQISNAQSPISQAKSRTTPEPTLTKSASDTLSSLQYTVLAPDAWQASLTVSLDSNTEITLSNDLGESYTLMVDVSNDRLVARRTALSGAYLFSPNFAVPTLSAPLRTDPTQEKTTQSENTPTATTDIILVIDHSSVEAFASDGVCVLTNTVYPTVPYTTLTCSRVPLSLSFRSLSTIWSTH